MQKQVKFQRMKKQAVAKTAVLPTVAKQPNKQETAVSPPIRPVLQRAIADPHQITTNDARVLQRTIGNQAIRRMMIQRKMTVGSVGDKYEQEADTVAKQVVGKLNTPQRDVTQRQEDEEDVQMKPISTVQRQEEDELQMKPSSTMNGGELASDIEGQIQGAKGGGRPLDANTKSSMGQAFNTDFSGVNIHTNGQADTLNRSLQARAFTSGQDIFFRSGEFSPNSGGGQELLAHELTHVVQQNGRQSSTVQRKSGSAYAQNQQIKHMLAPFQSNFGFQDGTPDTFKVTVGVSGGGEDYVDFAKKRMQSTIRNKARKTLKKVPLFGKFMRKAKSTSEIKNRSAEKVLESKGVEQPGQNEINQIINQSANVGHSWIKLTLLEGGNSLGTFSFGFVPGADVQHPAQPVAGVVRNPDIAYETTANTRFIDTEVSQKNFRNGLKKVTKLHAAPPDYTTSGYNCTKFAREVAKSAGATFPGGTGLMIPISDLGLFQKAYNPGKLYDKLGASEDSYTESPEQEALETGHGMNDEGQIISPEEAAAEREANWSENDVVDQLIRNRYFVSDEHDANEITIETGLTGMLLEKLSAASIRSMARDDPGAHALYLVFNAFDVTVPDGIDFYWWTPRGEDADFYEPEWRIRGVTPRY